MRENTREVDLDEFVMHLEAGFEAWEYIKEHECRQPLREVCDTDPEPAAPQELEELPPEEEPCPSPE